MTKEFTEIVKNLLESTKTLIIVGVAVVAILFQGTLSSWLDGLGVTTIDVFGAKMERSKARAFIEEGSKKLAETEEKLKELLGQLAVSAESNRSAAQAVEKLGGELTTAQREIERLRALTGGGGAQGQAIQQPAIDRLVADVKKQSISVSSQSTQTEADVQNTARSVQSTLDLLPSAVQERASPLGAHLLLFGSDDSESEARVEVDKAVRAGVGAPVIYLNRGKYRSTIEYADKQAAEVALSRWKGRGLAADSYVVRTLAWCPQPRRRDAGYVECIPPQR
jgi:hypothetical protein